MGARRARSAGYVVEVDGTRLAISHPDKVLWPGEGITKRDLVDYYLAVAPHVLAFVQDRPLTLKPYPRGIDGPSFFLRTRPPKAPDWLVATPYSLRSEQEQTCPIVAHDTRTLVWCANYNAIELHPWLSRVPDVERPDLLMFDLDPGPELQFCEALRVATALGQALDRQGLTGFPKTSGKRGVHILVPIQPGPTFEQARAFCEQVGRDLIRTVPDLVSLDYRIKDRSNKVLVDYSQNSVAKSTVAPYSVRPVPGARVSTPLTWTEVESGAVDPAAFTLRTIPARLEQVGNLIETIEARRAPLP